MADPIDWPMLYYTSRDPELHEAARACREALDRVDAAAIEWAAVPSSKSLRARVLAAAKTLRGARDRLEAIGARLWARHVDEVAHADAIAETEARRDG